MKKRFMIPIVLLAAVGITAAQCGDAATVSSNLSKAADMFEIDRKIVFYNGITDNYIAVIEGRCSINPISGRLEVVCKVSPDAYEKHFLGISDNVTYFAMQTKTADVSVYHNRIIWKPQSIIPDIDLNIDTKELNKDRY